MGSGASPGVRQEVHLEGGLQVWIVCRDCSFWESLGSRVLSLEYCWVLLSVVECCCCCCCLMLFDCCSFWSWFDGFFCFWVHVLGCFVMFFYWRCFMLFGVGWRFFSSCFDVVFTFSDVFWCLMSFYPFYHHCSVLWKFTLLFGEHSILEKCIPFWESFFPGFPVWGGSILNISMQVW